MNNVFDAYTDYEDVYITPTCDNTELIVQNGFGVDYDDQVFVFYEYDGKQIIMQGWLCKDENCKNKHRGRHLVPDLAGGGTLYFDHGHLQNVQVYTTQELYTIVQQWEDANDGTHFCYPDTED